MHDRPGDQLREEGDEQGVPQEIVFPRLAAVTVYQIGNLLEGEEADGQWQHHLGPVQNPASQPVDVVGEEVGVFVVAQQTQVANDPGDQQRAPGHIGSRRPAFGELATHQEVDQQAAQQQRQVLQLPIAVEEQAGKHQPALRCGDPAQPAQPEIDHQRGWQKRKQEDGGIEQHLLRLSRVARAEIPRI
ncbi:hypothetical protein D9M68_829390 [compost metagenome]